MRINPLAIPGVVALLQEKQRVIDQLTKIVVAKAQDTEPWWRWTRYLALAITIKRIRDA